MNGRLVGLSLVSLLALVAATGCEKKKDKGLGIAADALPMKDSVDLWRYAPEKVSIGMVLGEGSLVHLHDAGMTLFEAMKGAPGEAALAMDKLRKEVGLSKLDVFSKEAIANAGIDLSKGLAFFEGTDGKKIAVLPIGDAAKFLAFVEGKQKDGFDLLDDDMFCKMHDSRYLCVQDPAMYDGVVGGKGMAKEVKSWPKSQRGHLELWAGKSFLEKDGDIPEMMRFVEGMRLAVIFEKGGVTINFQMPGKPDGYMADAVPPDSPLVASLGKETPSAMALFRFAGLRNLFHQKALAEVPDAEALPGVNPRELLKSLTGDMAGYAPAGSPLRGFFKIGLTDEAPMKALLEQCDKIPIPSAEVKVSKKGDRCLVELNAGLGESMSLELWVEDNALVAGMGEIAAKSEGKHELHPVARSLIEEKWNLAVWGHGVAFMPEALGKNQALFQQSMLSSPEMQIAFWGLLHLSELGFAMRVGTDGLHGWSRIRTTWSNPKEVVDALEPMFLRISKGEFGAAAELGKVASAHPKSPWARDYDAGAGGMVPAFVAGIGAAVAIPAFMKYQQKSQGTEAHLMLRRLHMAAATDYEQKASLHEFAAGQGADQAAPAPQLPQPSSAITPPLGSCCQNPSGKCAPSAEMWTQEPWPQLRFSVDDPHYYSYQYQVAPDGHSFTVSAYGDLDCDGQYSTFSMTGQVTSEGISEGTLVESNPLE